MRKRKGLYWAMTGVAICFMLTGSVVSAADKTVVIPFGVTPGNATSADVIKGKTFSSKAAGKGVPGNLEIRDGSTIFTNSIGMKFSLIPKGSFIMGSPDGRNGEGADTHRPYWGDENGDPDESQHVVILSKPFYMQTTEVTQGQWEQVMGPGELPSHFSACGKDCPVEQVSWNDAQNFIDALNAREGRSNCNTIPNNCYSLPTESQWEYAARAGTVTALYSGAITNTVCATLDPNLDKIGWYCGNAGETTHPVAQKEPNAWGLYDMSGNVWEWCRDWYGPYPDGPDIDPTGAASGEERILRGGSWLFGAMNARSADRNLNPPDFRGFNLGFRVSMHLDP